MGELVHLQYGQILTSQMAGLERPSTSLPRGHAEVAKQLWNKLALSYAKVLLRTLIIAQDTRFWCSDMQKSCAGNPKKRQEKHLATAYFQLTQRLLVLVTARLSLS